MLYIKMILTNGFDPDIRVYKEAKYLVEQGHEVEIVCWDRERRNEREEEVINGIKIKRFFIEARYGTGIKQLPHFIRFIRETKKYIVKSKVDIIYCHDLDGGICGWIVKKRNNKLILDMHEYYFKKNKLINFIIKVILNRLQKSCYKIIYLNDKQKESVHKKNLKKLIYLPNYPVSLEYIPSNKSNSDNIRINYIGAVRDYLSIKNLIDASEGFERIRVGIHGIGPAYLQLKQEEKKYSHVNITGRYNGISDSLQLFNNTDILYCVYDMDNINWKYAFHVKFYEAIITQTPIIVEKRSSMAKLVLEYEIGKVVDGKNIEEIKKCIKSLMDNKEEINKMKINLQNLKDTFIWEKVCVNLKEIENID